MDRPLPQRLLQIAQVSIRSGEFSNFDPNPQAQSFTLQMGVVGDAGVELADDSATALWEPADGELVTHSGRRSLRIRDVDVLSAV